MKEENKEKKKEKRKNRKKEKKRSKSEAKARARKKSKKRAKKAKAKAKKVLEKKRSESQAHEYASRSSMSASSPEPGHQRILRSVVEFVERAPKKVHLLVPLRQVKVAGDGKTHFRPIHEAAECPSLTCNFR